MSRRPLIWVAPLVLIPPVLLCVLSLLFPLPPSRPYSLVVEDRQGRFIQAFLARDGAWRLKTSPEEIPARLKSILLEKEDRWFYYHPGVNPGALVRALIHNIATGRRQSGASTITMQLARMLEPKERTYVNKAVEVFRAFQLEWRYSKDELLEMYLSMIPLGGNVEGLKSAALIYYQTPLERLNIAQLIDLILIPNNPNMFRPDKAGERLVAERKRRARRWLADGFLTGQDSLIIWSAPGAASRGSLPRHAPHFALRVKQLFPGAAVLRTGLDLDLQHRAEVLLSNHLRPWKRTGVRNGAILVVDNATREIRAYVGSESFDDAAAQGQVDAVRAVRSPGSTLKPFLYALQMEHGELTPRTMLLDTPYDAEGFLAENYDGTYAGLVYASDALQRSLNVPMVRMLKHTGLEEFLDFLGSVGIASPGRQRDRLGLSLILGGCGVTLEEMTTAYASFAAGGNVGPIRYRMRVPEDSLSIRRVFSPATAFMVTDILTGLERPDLPNNFVSSASLPLVAFKTGTSYGRRDAWCMGYSGEFTIGVWIGNVNNRGNPDLVGSKSAAPLLIDLFTSLSSSFQKSILPVPRDLRMRPVCARSGLPPSPQCERVIDDWYAVKQTRTGVCAVCTEFLVSPDRTVSYCASCLGDHPYHSVTYAQYAPELLHFWRQQGAPYETAPGHNPACSRVFAGEGPSILSPSDRMTYYLVARKQQLVLQAGSSVDVRAHRWYMDDVYLGTNRPGERLFVHPRQGTHTIACLDDRGRLTSVQITVRYMMD